MSERVSDLGKQIQNIHGAERFLVKCEVQSIDVPIASLLESLSEGILIARNLSDKIHDENADFSRRWFL